VLARTRCSPPRHDLHHICERCSKLFLSGFSPPVATRLQCSAQLAGRPDSFVLARPYSLRLFRRIAGLSIHLSNQTQASRPCAREARRAGGGCRSWPSGPARTGGRYEIGCLDLTPFRFFPGGHRRCRLPPNDRSGCGRCEDRLLRSRCSRMPRGFKFISCGRISSSLASSTLAGAIGVDNRSLGVSPRRWHRRSEWLSGPPGPMSTTLLWRDSARHTAPRIDLGGVLAGESAAAMRPRRHMCRR